MSHYARKQDSSARVVIDAFEAAGCSVLVITSTRAGCPDLAVGISGRTHLVEVKPDISKSRERNLRPSQVAFADSWRGGPVHVIRNATEAFQLVGLLRMTAAPGWPKNMTAPLELPEDET